METNKGYREDLEGRKGNDVNITSKIKDKQRENWKNPMNKQANGLYLILPFFSSVREFSLKEEELKMDFYYFFFLSLC